MPLKPANDHLNQTLLCSLVIVQHQTTITVSNPCVRREYMQVTKFLLIMQANVITSRERKYRK